MTSIAVRFDVSKVPPQGGYVAKQCPVRIQYDILLPGAVVPVSPEVQLRIDQGIAFEATIFAALLENQAPGWVFVPPNLDRETAIAVTLAAMANGADLIAGGWLPADQVGRRTGKPDLLVLHEGGFVPIDVKHHLTLSLADDDESIEVSDLASPSPDARTQKTGWEARKHKGDLLQLAHYRRMLEACGYASRSTRAGIMGKEGVVVWHDLERPMWQTPAKTRKRKLRTTMEIYDFEFGFRLDIAAVAQQQEHRQTAELLVEPVWTGECPDCPWVQHCGPILNAGSGDPSLLPSIGYREWRLFRDQGITDRAGVARLSYRTAQLLAEGGDPNTEPDLDPATATLGRAPFLPKAILHVWAATGTHPLYRLPGRSGSEVPRADLELDIDMESTNDGVYLWGVLVTDRVGSGLVKPGYRPFVSWDPIDAAVELDLFRWFMRWLNDVLSAASHARLSVNAYCWYAGAENTQMKRIAAADPALADMVAALIASPHWIDLERVFAESWTTGGSRSLKAIAPPTGHAWEVDDPGGGLSMVKHLQATGSDRAEEARAWLLAYNRGDVEATLRIREWLDYEGANFPEIDSK